jgi:ParB/RepB/Spo0J family partition protein
MNADQKALMDKRRGKPNPLDLINQQNASYVANMNPTSSEIQVGEQIIKLHVTSVYPNPYQHRTFFDPAETAELAASIKANGQNQPIGVRKKGDHYEIIFGERRWRACQLLEDKLIDVVVREISDQDMILICLSENSHRKKPYDYETYRGITFLVKEGLSMEAIIANMVISSQDFYKYMAYDSLHPNLKDFIHDNPGAIQRNDAAEIVKLYKDFNGDVPDKLTSDLLDLMQKYLNKEITSRGEIVKRAKALYAVKKTRHREKVNHDFTLSMGESKVGTLVKTPSEVRFMIDKSELEKNKLDELEAFLESFFRIAPAETA